MAGRKLPNTHFTLQFHVGYIRKRLTHHVNTAKSLPKKITSQNFSFNQSQDSSSHEIGLLYMMTIFFQIHDKNTI